jgi:fructoselysine-6-P-deglycase FrlB-like protein
MDPLLFSQDLELGPSRFRELLQVLEHDDPWAQAIGATPRRIVLLGMGSSHFANCVLALRLQAAGIVAHAVLASADPLPLVDADDVVIAVSASGGSAETLAATRHYTGHCRIVTVTNTAGSAIEALGDAHVSLHAGVEEGGVACRSFTHTLALHLALVDRLTGSAFATSALRGAIAATEDLLGRRDAWLDEVAGLLLGPTGTTFVAPVRRLSSAQQSALMLREGPRLPAIACETGDWSHIDVYLTKTTDYRMLLLPGSTWEPQLWEWTTQRGSTVVVAGADAEQAAFVLRYVNDDADDVRLLAEPLVASLVSARTWAAQS